MTSELATRQPELVDSLSLAKDDLLPWQKVLLDAATVLEATGWVPGNLISGHSHCAVGAMATVSGTSDAWMRDTGNWMPNPVMEEAAIHLASYLKLRDSWRRGMARTKGRHALEAIIGWNDSHNRVEGYEKKTVATAMRKCVEDSRAR